MTRAETKPPAPGRRPNRNAPSLPASSRRCGWSSAGWMAIWRSRPSAWPMRLPADCGQQTSGPGWSAEPHLRRPSKHRPRSIGRARRAEHERILTELAGRARAEEEVRGNLSEQRLLVRRLEQELQSSAQSLRALEGERTALEGELASLRERAAQADAPAFGDPRGVGCGGAPPGHCSRARRLPEPRSQARGGRRGACPPCGGGNA